jgi:chemotaxis response regulator CheB
VAQHWRIAQSARIVLVELPRLTSDLLQRLIDGASGLKVVATADDADDLLMRLDEVAPDVLLWGVSGVSLAERAWPVLRRCTELPIVGISSAGRAAAVCTLRPHVEPVPDVSGPALVDLVRRLAGPVP